MQKINRCRVEEGNSWLNWPALLACHEAQLSAFILAHIVMWTLVPAITHSGLPIDVVEGYSLGREWLIGSSKHPAMPSWLLESSRLLTGAVGWPAYFLSGVCIGLTYAITYLLGRELMEPREALSGTLLLSGVIYFSWVSPEFNHNVLQMPFWVGIVWTLWRCRERRDWASWMILGAMSAGSLYAKLSTGVLLLVCGCYILIDAKCRKQLLTARPWVGLVIFLVLSVPLVSWLVGSELRALTYAQSRAFHERTGGILLFMLKQAASGLGLVLIAAFAAGGFRELRAARNEATVARPVPGKAVRYLVIMFVAPFGLVLIYAAVTRAGLKGSWGTSMLSLAGLILIAALGNKLDPVRILRAATFLVFALPLAYGTHVLVADRFTRSPQRVSWPQSEIADRLSAIWHRQTGAPLRIVAGEGWLAGIVSANAKDRPSLLMDGDHQRSPWIGSDRLAKEGVLVMWRQKGDQVPASLQGFVGNRSFGTVVFKTALGRRQSDKPDHIIEINYVVVPPAGAAKAP